MKKILSLSIVFLISICVPAVTGNEFVYESKPTASCEMGESSLTQIATNSVEIHENMWKTIVTEARTDHYSKYGIYVSRTLAVTHPEIYLKADGLFVKAATTNKGFKKAFDIKDVHDLYLFRPDFTGPPFSFDDVDFAGYTIIESHDCYPHGYAVLPFFDRRVLPIASTLKSAAHEITQLELGVQYYFACKKENMYLIYCDNENTYVYNDNLIWMKTLEEPEEIEGNPILIFNEQYVWYPLMERDDSSKDNLLKELVSTYTKEVTTPLLTDFEKELLPKLKQVTALPSDYEEDTALIFTMRPCWEFNSYAHSNSFDNVVKSRADLTAFDLELFSRPFLTHANYLSPITAYLAAVTKEYTGEEKIEELLAEYVKHASTPNVNYAHGHVWFCNFVEQTVEESYTTKGGHCIVQACNIAAVLDLVGIGSYWLQGYSGDIHFIHDWLYIPEFGIVVSNGAIMHYEGTVLFHSTGMISLNQIDFVGFKDKWAFFRDLRLRGTMSPGELIEVLTELEGFHHDHIQILTDSGEGVSYKEFITLLQEQQNGLDLVEAGLQKKEKGELKDALQHLFAAYSGLKKARYYYTDVVYDGMSLLDLEEELVFLCLHFIKTGDDAMKDQQYEDAFCDFVFVYSYWQTFYSSSALVLDSEEYQEKYADIGAVYTVWVLEEKIRECMQKIEDEAEELKESGYGEESNEKYDFIIAVLTEADWKYQEDIKELESKKGTIEIYQEEKRDKEKQPQFDVFIIEVFIVGAFIIAFVVIVYKRKM